MRHDASTMDVRSPPATLMSTAPFGSRCHGESSIAHARTMRSRLCSRSADWARHRRRDRNNTDGGTGGAVGRYRGQGFGRCSSSSPRFVWASCRSSPLTRSRTFWMKRPIPRSAAFTGSIDLSRPVRSVRTSEYRLSRASQPDHAPNTYVRSPDPAHSHWHDTAFQSRRLGTKRGHGVT